MGSKAEKVKTIFYWSKFQGQEVGRQKQRRQDKIKPENNRKKILNSKMYVFPDQKFPEGTHVDAQRAP